MKKLSVITVNKDNAEGLEKTIISVVGQTFKDYEFIIIDGGSTDNSVEVIEKYTGHIDYWVSEPDNGIYHAMNKGIAQATGEYTIFMNSGDCFISNDVLFNVFFEKRTADMLAGTAVTSDVFGKERRYPPNKITFYRLLEYTLWHQALFMKKALFDELGGYDESLKIVADWKFYLLAIVKYNKSVEMVKTDIALIEPDGISSHKDSEEIILREKKEILMEYFPYFYDDYIFLSKVKKFTWYYIKRSVRWRLNRLFRK